MREIKVWQAVKRFAVCAAAVLMVAVGLAVPGGAQSEESPVLPEPPAQTPVGRVSGQVQGGVVGAEGSEVFVPVPAVVGVPPADGPFSEDLGRLDESGGVVGGSGGGPDPSVSPTPVPVAAEDSSGGVPVPVVGEFGPAPEGFGGLAPCGGGYVCGAASILPAPTGLSCAVTSSSIVLSWNAVAGAHNYTAKSQLGNGQGTQTVVTTTATSATFSGLVSSTRYYIGVHSNVGGVAQYYSGIYCTTAVGPPVCGVVSASSVRLDWRADSRVHRWYAARKTASGSFVDGRSISGSSLTTTFTGLSRNATYTFYFWWQKSHGGAWQQVHPSTSCTTVAPPSAPTVSCTTTASSITVTWESVAGASKYRVSRGNGWAAASGRRHVFSNLTASTTYAVRVQGGNAAGWGANGTASCMTKSAILPAPTGLSCAATATSIRFSWNAVTGADSYSAKIQLAVAGSQQTEKNTASTSVVFDGLVAGTKYWVSVLAVKDGEPQHFTGMNCSTLTNIAAPVVSCAATSDSVTATWGAVTRASRYRAKVGSGAWTADLTSTSHEFTGLSPGRSYKITVQSGGEASWGLAGSVTCVTAAEGVSCGKATVASVELKWQARPGATRWYAARAVLGGHIDGRVLAGPASGELSTVFTGLSKGTEYVLRLWRFDGSRWHEITPSLRCSTTHVAAPVLTGHTTGGNTLTVEWTRVDGAELYQARFRRKQSGIAGQSEAAVFSDWMPVVSTGPNHTFTGLEPNTEYTVEVRAGKNIAGAMHWSVHNSAAHKTSPATCSAISTTAFTISWNYPGDRYHWETKRITGINQYADTRPLAKGSATSVQYTGLEPGTTYWIGIWRRAETTGQWQPYTPFPHCHTAPSNPTITQCPQTADVDGTVRWTPNGATAYRIAPNGNAANPNWIITNASAYTFTGLAEGTTYTVKLQARNPAGWSTGSTCQMKTLPAIPANTLTTSTGTKYYFTKGTVKGVLYAAGKAINDRSTSTETVSRFSCRNGGTITTNQLAAIMLSIPIHEVPAGTSESRAPSPMVLSRWDNLGQQIQSHAGVKRSLNIRLYSHMDEAGYLRAHWSPGVGLWQLDKLNTATINMNHAERADTTKGGVSVAKFLLHEYCRNTVKDQGLRNALNGRWFGCKPYKRDENGNRIKDEHGDYIRIPDVCYNTYKVNHDKIYNNGRLNIGVVEAHNRTDGGVQERTCQWNSNEQEMPCYLYDLDAAQGQFAGDDKTGQESDQTPLAKAFVSFTDLNTGTKYAVWPKQWPTSLLQTSWPTDVVATDKTIFRAVKQNEEVRCSPGLDPTPEGKRHADYVEIGQDCAEETYKPFGNEIAYHNFSGGNKIVEGWYDDSVPYRDGGAASDRHSLQVQTCEAKVIAGQAIVRCWWVDV